MKREIEEQGYYIGLKLLPVELDYARHAIKHQWRKTLEAKGIQSHHEITQHGAMWPKSARILPADVSSVISKFSIFKKLREEFGDFTVSDEENVGHPEFIWRLVRPDHPEDVGPLHADEWFWTLAGRKTGPRMRLWTAIYCEPGQGFMFSPGSHKETHQWTEVNGKPVPSTVDAMRRATRFNCEPGDCILFHDKLIHGGVGGGTKTRVSLEFTIILPEQKPLHDMPDWISMENTTAMRKYGLTIEAAHTPGYWVVRYEKNGFWATGEDKSINEAVKKCVHHVEGRKLEHDGYTTGAT